MFEVLAGQLQEGACGAGSPFLYMDESAGQLDKALKKIAVRPSPLRQPKFLEHLVGFEIKLPIKARDEASQIRIETLVAPVLT